MFWFGSLMSQVLQWTQFCALMTKRASVSPCRFSPPFSAVTVTDPFSTFWAVYAAMCETILPPVHTRIMIDLDMQARRATCTADNIATGRGEPILNPVTGTEHRAGIVLPNGFEYGQNEVGRGWSTSTGGVALTLEDSYAHWCELHFNRHGRIH